MTPFFFPMVLPNMAAGNLSHYLGFKGYNATVSTACAASNQAIGEALGVIRNGLADVVFAGGSEAGISELGLSGFSVMRALTTRMIIQLLRVDPLTSIGMDLYPQKGQVSWYWKI